MEPVSSVIAFVSRHLRGGDPPPEVHEILAGLSPDERRVIDTLATIPDPGERLRALAQETGEPWSAARYQRFEARAQMRLRSELLRRGMLQA